jgi:putative SOS response-associated peptidase YedK
MCGRYTQTKLEALLRKRFRLSSVEGTVVPRYNLAPGQEAPVILAESGGRILRPMRWGLVPLWAKDPAIGAKLINARGETLTAKPAFRAAFRSRRCLVPADGFYEWKKERTRKVPLRFTVDGGEPFALAGLFEHSRAEGELSTFTIVTTDANALVAEVHDRMPVVLSERDEDAWLDPGRELLDLAPLLAPFPPERMEAHRASIRLNRVENDDPGCLDAEAAPGGKAPQAQRSLFDDEER